MQYVINYPYNMTCQEEFILITQSLLCPGTVCFAADSAHKK